MTRRRFDIGLVVPLKEEFEYLIEVVPITDTLSFEGTYFYILEFGPIQAVCTIVGDMGPLPACQSTTRMLRFADVQAVIVLGLGGSLDSDVRIGDVVVADKVTEYLANSKATPSGDGYAFKHGGRHWIQEYKVREQIRQADLIAAEVFEAWHREAELNFMSLEIADKESVANCPPKYHVGGIASGDIVAASSAFVTALKNIDRKLLAIDMEAAGVCRATFDQLAPTPTIIIRGISDQANEQKSDLDSSTKGGWRRYCVQNATSFLCALLRWPEFTSCIGVIPANSRASLDLAHTIEELQNVTGAVWLLGVALGNYGFAPYLSNDGTVVARSIAQVRIESEYADEFFGNVIELGNKIQDNSASRKHVPESIASLVQSYCTLSGIQASDPMLSDFDNVLHAVFEFADESQPDGSLESISKIDAAISDQSYDEAKRLLGSLDSLMPDARSRYAEIEFGTRDYPAVINRLADIDPNELSRNELEWLISAGIKIGSGPKQTDWIAIHGNRFKDRLATLFRKQIGVDLRQEKGMS